MNWVWKVDLTPAARWEDSASNLDVWRQWDATMRQRCGWRAGLAFWGKTNTEGGRVLLSRHWPHRLCWSWSIWVGLRRGVDMDGPSRVSLVIGRPYRFCEIQIVRAYVRVTWQNYGWMVASRYEAGAPTIYWKHHLEHAVPAGTA